jgi:signal peptidase I
MKRRHALLLMAMVLAAFAGCNGSSWSSGDRVLVAKFLYDSHLEKPQRYDVVVFKYPKEPLKNQVPTNYIKRLLGLPGELLAILFGRIYRCDDDASQDLRRQLDDRGRSGDDLDLWKDEFMHRDDPRARELFLAGKFKILRKSPATMLAMRRIVDDNDHQAKDLKGVLPPRWIAEEGGWTADDKNGFVHKGQANQDVGWLRYQHILRPEDWPSVSAADKKPQLIRDFSGYNSYETRGEHKVQPPNWVGDLMLEFQLTVDRAEGELWLELARGVDRFQASWNLQTGDCTLYRIGQEQPLDVKKTRINKPGTYQVRFANFDDRLTVWVNGDLPFDDGVAYLPASQPGPTANDLKPVLIGAKKAAVKVHQLKLWRDTYYTAKTGISLGTPDAVLNQAQWNDPEFWSDPKRWEPLGNLEPTTLYVQPGHYLCLGDNSPESSDSRSWGVVPERLMLGRALMVYYPFNRAGPIK